MASLLKPASILATLNATEPMRAADQDVDQLRTWNLGGIAAILDARVTPDELARTVALIRG